jgi:hypothetical protein
LRALGRAAGALGSSWDRPTPSELRYLEIAERKARAALDAVRALFADELPVLRRLAADAGVATLGDPPDAAGK